MEKGGDVMLQLISIEMLKLKRSKIFMMLCGVTFINTLLSYFMLTRQPDMDTLSLGALLEQNIHFFNLFLGIPLFAITAGIILSQEYQNHLTDQLFTYKASETRILLSKYILLLLLVGFTLMFSFGLTYILGIVVTDGSVENGANVFLSYIISAVLHFMLIPIVVFITILSKNLVGPITIAVITVFSTGLISATALAPFYPWSLPVRFSYYILGVLDVSLAIAGVTVLITFMVPFVLSIYYFKKV